MIPKTKLRIYSDLHLDHYDLSAGERLIPCLPDDENTILILAGDLSIGTLFIMREQPYPYSWLSIIARRFKHVVIVLGNHDFWSDCPEDERLSIREGGKKAQQKILACGIENATILSSEAVEFELDGILFVGATFWTDLNKGNPIAAVNLPNQMIGDSKIEFWAGDENNPKPPLLTAKGWALQHLIDKKMIEVSAKSFPDKKIVVVTHHAPLLNLSSSSTHFNAAYYESDCSDLILDNPNIVFWAFGHTHENADFQLEHCRVYSNPIGYQGEHREQAGLVRHEVIEV